MDFLIIIWGITVGLCWFASIEWAYHYGRAKQAEEIRFRMRQHGIVFKRDETSLADRKKGEKGRGRKKKLMNKLKGKNDG